MVRKDRKTQTRQDFGRPGLSGKWRFPLPFLVMTRFSLLLLSGALAWGCGDDGTAPDASLPDASAPSDASTPTDASVQSDAAVQSDASVESDAGVDAGAEDCSPRSLPSLGAEDIVADHTFAAPVDLQSPPGDDRLFVVEKGGFIRIVEDGALVPEPFLDLSEGLLSGGEQGLLGLAFHPNYAENRRFFVFFTPGSPRRNVVAEYRASDDPNVADPTEVARLVEVNDSESNHNGGALHFGPDGHLYAAMGDEGGGGDDHGDIGNALDRSNLFGTLLRLDVDAPERDFAPASPAFADGLPQIWHYGLRNPWRFSFDRDTGDLYIGDVGQNAIEEIDFLPAGHPGGANFGWRAYEGTRVFDEGTLALVPEHTEPLVEYPRRSIDPPIDLGCSVTGGYVYRGDAIEALDGFYLYGDYCSQSVAAFRRCDGEVTDHQRLTDLRAGGDGIGNGLASFGQDSSGELYLLYVASGHVRRIVER